MNVLKSLLRGLLGLIYKLSIVLLAIVGPLVMVFGTSTQIKHTLTESKVYDASVNSLADGLVQNIANDGNNGGQGEEAPAAPELTAAAKTAITPTFVQNTAEQVIDGIYGWLQGKTDSPQFSIDIAATKQQFAQSVGDYAVNRAKGLPTCTVAQARELASQGEVDPLTSTCLPAGFDVNKLRTDIDKAINEVREGGDNPLQSNVITADTLPKDDDGKNPVQNLTEGAQNAPKAFHWFTTLPLILLVSALLSAVLILLLHDDKRRGIRNLGITTLVVGVLICLGVFGSNAAFAALSGSNSPITKDIDAAVKQPAVDAIHSMGSALNSKLIMYGAVYVALGVIALVALHVTKPKTEVAEHLDHTSPDTPADVESSTETVEKTESPVEEPKAKEDK